MRSRAFRPNPPLTLAPCALLLLLDCGIARGPKPEVDSESHFLGCNSETDCGGIAGATCASGWCVDVETGERIHPNALGNENWDALPPGSSTDDFPVDGNWMDGVDGPEASASAPDASPLEGSVAADLDPPPPAPPCYTSSPSSSSLVPIYEDQAALAGLAGCETIYGDMEITFDADLRALRSLRQFIGSLNIHPASQQLSSLAGLESLELVSGNLRLQYLHAPSLTSLAHLQAVGARAGQGLLLVDSSGLRDLSGLAQLTSLHNLSIAGSFEFASFDGLTMPTGMESVTLSDLPALRSLPPINVSSLTLENTGLTDLSTVTGRVDELAVRRNSLLVDATVSGVDRLIVESNPALVMLSLPPQGSYPSNVQVTGNRALESIVAPDTVVTLGTLSVAENPALHTISMQGLQQLDQFQVIRNPSLSAIELPLLIQQVEDLTVVSNPNLSMPSIFSITGRAKKSKLAGNQGDPLFLDPCPFIRDTFCDAPPVDSICAAGTDRYDCGEKF